MPYKRRDAWHRQMREYLKEKAHISAMTRAHYTQALDLAGGLLEWPNPSKVSLAEMHRLEATMKRSSNTRAIYCSVIRTFLRWSGNRDAMRWTISAKAQAKVDGVFLSEPTVETLRLVSRRLSNDHELLYSLAVDNGCRLIDMERMTVQNAKEMLNCQLSMILSKGRGGGKMRPLALNSYTIAPLAKHLEGREGATRLFPYRKLQMYRKLKQISEASGVRFAPHDLRRTFGNRHWRAGTPIETIARLMGHESVDMTFKAYIGVQMEDMLSAQAKLCPSWSSQQVSERLAE